MYKKIGIIVFILAIFILTVIQTQGCSFFGKKIKIKHKEDKIEIKTEKKDEVKEEIRELSFVPVNEVNDNKIWVGTFQLVWNDLVDEIVKSPVEFVDYESELANSLNKKGFIETDISENSYYKTYGYMTKAFKKEIEKNLKEKLNETSDILDSLDWNPENFLLYAMLKKDFKYLTEFKILNEADFMGEKVKYFGFNLNDRKELQNNARVLFYNSKDDFASKLITKEGEEAILYRTNDKKTLEEFYKDLNEKTKNYNGNKYFTDDDNLKVPYIKFDKMFHYNEFVGRQIKNSDFMITEAIQTVKFKMDNKGGSLKSEVAVVGTNMAAPSLKDYRYFEYDKPFVLFLKEKDKSVPYFIVHFVNADLFEKP